VDSAFAEVETISSTGDNIKKSILKEMASATLTLDLAIHEVTSLDLVQSLVKAKHRGVKLRIVADSKKVNLRTSQISHLIHQGILVKVFGGKEKGMTNCPFTILDGKRVLMGIFD
jgi:hypothetical protein